jgi:hypothetical protein
LQHSCSRSSSFSFCQIPVCPSDQNFHCPWKWPCAMLLNIRLRDIIVSFLRITYYVLIYIIVLNRVNRFFDICSRSINYTVKPTKVGDTMELKQSRMYRHYIISRTFTHTYVLPTFFIIHSNVATDLSYKNMCTTSLNVQLFSECS